MTDKTRITRAALLRLLDVDHLDACGDSLDWIREQKCASPQTLWATCPRGDWMLWIAGRAGVRRQDLVLSACACARLALPYVRAGEERPRIAIETAERWARGEAGVTLEQVRAAASAASNSADADAASAAYAAASAAYAAASAAYAAASAAYAAASADADVAAYAASAYAAAYAAASASADADADDRSMRHRCADVVREQIPWAMVRDAVAAKIQETP